MSDVTPFEALVVALPAFVLIGFSLADALERLDLTGRRRAMWVLVIVLVPVIGSFLYVLARPLPLARRSAAPDSPLVVRFVELLDRRERGEVATDEFVAAVHELVDVPYPRGSGPEHA